MLGRGREAESFDERFEFRMGTPGTRVVSDLWFKSGDPAGLVLLVPALQGVQAGAGVLGQGCQSDVVFDVESKNSPLLRPVHLTPVPPV